MSVYKVYVENSCIRFAPEGSAGDGEPSLAVSPGESVSMTKLLQKLQFTKKLTVISEKIESVFDGFRASMPLIEAGGGLVSDAGGRVLMIFRNGRWDLPKGKLEPGERIEECAVREVSEECALPLQELRRDDKIADTYHCYRIGDRWVLKRTSWYRMRYAGAVAPRPQPVEGITRAEWVARAQIPARLSGAYYTIRDVFREAGLSD